MSQFPKINKKEKDLPGVDLESLMVNSVTWRHEPC